MTAKLGQKGVSISEVILIILLISILSIIVIPRFNGVVMNAKYQTCRTNVANINALVQLYYIKEGAWPANNLSDIKTNINYFPEQALPNCPVTAAAAYTLDGTTHRVTGHLTGNPTHP
jgi:general secretion pathway protein G